MHLWSERPWYTLVCVYVVCVCVIMGLSFFHVYIKLFVCEFLCEIPLGAVAPEGRGCPPVSWQSSGSHGNEARDAPALDLWCSPPPEELREKEREKEMESKTEPITQASSKIYAHEQFKGGSKNCRNWSRPKEKLVRPITAARPSFIRPPLCC